LKNTYIENTFIRQHIYENTFYRKEKTLERLLSFQREYFPGGGFRGSWRTMYCICVVRWQDRGAIYCVCIRRRVRGAPCARSMWCRAIHSANMVRRDPATVLHIHSIWCHTVYGAVPYTVRIRCTVWAPPFRLTIHMRCV
jgi:hypothetical protein